LINDIKHVYNDTEENENVWELNFKLIIIIEMQPAQPD